MRKTGALVLLFACLAAGARRHPSRPSATQPGVFDYYLLSLSWSPEHCSDHNDSPQCDGTRRYGFVVHGLWPQFERGYPQDCGGRALSPGQIPADVLEIMPSRPLITHEWQKHGTCSGLSPAQYFKKIEDAYVLVKIPNEYKAPLQNVEVTPASIKQKFAQANPQFPPQAFRLACRGRFLQEVRVCYSKDLQGRACGNDVRDSCSLPQIIMRPVR